MKEKARRVFIRLLVLMVAAGCVFAPYDRAEATSLHIYTQNDYGDTAVWGLAGSSSRTLKTGGNIIFAFAHAIEWLTGMNRGDDLLAELIGVCSDPTGKYNHPDCTHPNSNDYYRYFGYAYLDHAESAYGISYVSVNKTEASLESCLTGGGVALLRGPSGGGGHVLLLTGFVRASDGTVYLRAADPQPSAYHESSARLTYYDDSFRAWTSYPQDGAEYWFRFSDIASKSDFQIWYGMKQDSQPVCPHTESSWLLVKNPTRRSDGIKERRCTACGEVLESAAIRLKTLPAGLTQIEAEAFAGTAFEAVEIPDGCESIGNKAFANCQNLMYVRIPASVTSVAANAFAGSGQAIIDRITQ